MLEEVKPKAGIISSTTTISSSISSSSDIANSIHSKSNIFPAGREALSSSSSSSSRRMTRTDSNTKNDSPPAPSEVDPATEAQEEEEGSDTMEDAISDVTVSTSTPSPGDHAAAAVGDKESVDDANSSATKKRVHFADDADSSSIFRSSSVDSLGPGGKDSSASNAANGPRSNLRKRASSNVNPRPAHLARKQRETFQGDHLNITPADSLEFVVMDFQKETLDIINLKNTTEEVVTYKVKTTAPEKYRVRPSTGLIQPGAAIDVNVYLPPGMHSTNRDKFLIMSLVVGSSSDCEPDNKGLNEINELWKSASKDDIVEHRIRCVLIDQSQSSFADETIAKDVGLLKDALEKNSLALVNVQRQCADLEETVKWNQLFLKLAIAVLLLVLFLTFLTWQHSSRNSTALDSHYCHDKYSSSSSSTSQSETI